MGQSRLVDRQRSIGFFLSKEGISFWRMDALFFILQMDTFFFSHDYNARSDDKIKRLIRKHGMIGYGVFWAIVEDLYQNANAMRTDCDGIAYDLRVQSDLVQSVLFDFDLFIHEGDIFGSISIQKRLEQRLEKSIKASKSAHKRWDNANAMRPHSDRNAIKESKVKDIKGKEIKLNEIKGERAGARSPALVECVEIFSDLEHPQYAESFYNYYESNGWLKGSNPIVNITAAAKTWIEKENKLYNQNKPLQNGLNKPSASTNIEQYANHYNDCLDYIEKLGI